MAVWTVVFGDDPRNGDSQTCVTLQVRVFDQRRSAYAFRDLCNAQGVYADVRYRTHERTRATMH